MHLRIRVLFLLLSLPVIIAYAQFDVVIKNGHIIDGSGNPWYVADVGIRDGRIVAIGRLDTTQCHHVLDARGMIVAPGFIDVHTHSEGGIRRTPTADNFLFDGVTSLITGNCGGSETAIDSFFAEVRHHGISVNLATFVGHNSVRREVMGNVQRDPSAEEPLAVNLFSAFY